MNVNRLTNLPEDIISKIVSYLDFKDLASLDQSCIEVNKMICEKKIWGNYAHSMYGFSQRLDNIKIYLSNHTVFNPKELSEKFTKFFNDTLYSNNVYFKCLFKGNIGVIEFERLQDSLPKNSITILYIGSLDESTKCEIKKTLDHHISLHEILFQESFKKISSFKEK